MKGNNLVRRIISPAIGIILGVGLHFTYFWLTTKPDSVQRGWLEPSDPRMMALAGRYFQSGEFYFGLSLAFSLAFAVHVLRRFRARLRKAASFAAGGVTAGGLIAVGGCWLVGCCGSPLLPFYLGIFGASFIPLAAPLAFALTILFIALSWYLLRRSEKSVMQSVNGLACACGSGEECCESEPSRISPRRLDAIESDMGGVPAAENRLNADRC